MEIRFVLLEYLRPAGAAVKYTIISVSAHAFLDSRHLYEKEEPNSARGNEDQKIRVVSAKLQITLIPKVKFVYLALFFFLTWECEEARSAKKVKNRFNRVAFVVFVAQVQEVLQFLFCYFRHKFFWCDVQYSFN